MLFSLGRCQIIITLEYRSSVTLPNENTLLDNMDSDAKTNPKFAGNSTNRSDKIMSLVEGGIISRKSLDGIDAPEVETIIGTYHSEEELKKEENTNIYNADELLHPNNKTKANIEEGGARWKSHEKKERANDISATLVQSNTYRYSKHSATESVTNGLVGRGLIHVAEPPIILEKSKIVASRGPRLPHGKNAGSHSGQRGVDSSIDCQPRGKDMRQSLVEGGIVNRKSLDGNSDLELKKEEKASKYDADKALRSNHKTKTNTEEEITGLKSDGKMDKPYGISSNSQNSNTHTYGQFSATKSVANTPLRRGYMDEAEKPSILEEKVLMASRGQRLPRARANASKGSRPIQRGVDSSVDYKPPPLPTMSLDPSLFTETDSPSPSLVDEEQSRPGAHAIPGLGSQVAQPDSINSSYGANLVHEDAVDRRISHHSSKSLKAVSEKSEKLITAFLVEDIEERGIVTLPDPATATSTPYPLAEAKAVVDDKTRRRRILCGLLVCLVAGAVGGVLAALLLNNDSETRAPATDIPTIQLTTNSPTIKATTEVPTLMPSTTTPTPLPTLPQFEWVQTGSDISGGCAESSSADEFGRSVSLSSDGMKLAVGARFCDVGSSVDAGHVRVFALNNNSWDQLGNDIIGQNLEKSSQSISLSDDGNTLAVGAQTDHIVRIYQYNSTDWDQLGEDITVPGRGADGLSTSYLSLSGNGLTVAMGAPFNARPESNAGLVTVFRYDSAEMSWNQLGNDIYGDEEGDTLGFSTWLNEDGSILAAGAFQLNDGNPGYARVYQFTNNTWNAIGGRINGDADNDHFGVSVSLSEDSSVLAVGADVNDRNGNGAGHVKVFHFNQTNVRWEQIGDNIDGENGGDHAGLDSVISSNGTIVAVGSRENDDGGDGSGHVRLFRFDTEENGWEQLGQTIVGRNGGDHFGISLSFARNGTMVVIGGDGGYARAFQLVQNY